MRPYDPENPDATDQNDQGGDPTNRANWSEGAFSGTDTTMPGANPGLADAPSWNPAPQAQPVDYTYNSSLGMADAIDSDTGTNARVSIGDPTADGISGGTMAAGEQDVYPASTTLPPGTRDVTPSQMSADYGSTGIVGEHGQDDKSKMDSDAETTDETEAIRADIEQTRSQMSATIDAIQGKLNPQNIVDQAKGAVREATIGRVENMVTEVRQTAQEASSGFLDTVKENPLPTAMAAIGLGWLFMKSRNKSSYGRGYDYSSYDRYGNYNRGYDNNGPNGGGSYRFQPSGAGYDYNGQSGGPGQVVERAQEKMGDAADKVGRTVTGAAGQVRDTVGNAAESVGDAAGNLVGNIQGKAGDIGSGVQQGAQVAQNQLQKMLYENPLALGAAAVVIGAAIGMLLPETEPEHRLMGEAKETVMDKAQNVAQQAIDKVSRVAEQATNTAQEAARNEGLSQ